MQVGNTYAMQSKDDEGGDSYWLFKMASKVEVLEEAIECPVIQQEDGTAWEHEKGDHVVAGYFWSDVEGELLAYTLMDETKVYIPIHLILTIDDIKIKPRDKQGKKRRKKKTGRVFTLDKDMHETIIGALPEPWTPEYMQ